VIVALALTLASAGCTTIVRSSSAPNGADANAAAAQPTSASSDNGRYVVFGSAASNLVPGDTNGVYDIFRRDHQTGMTIRVSVDNAGNQLSTPSGGAGISGDGRHVHFTTESSLEPADTNGAADVYVRSIDAGTTERVSIKPDGTPVIVPVQYQGLARITISDDGRYVLVTDSLPYQGHAYLRDRLTDTTTLLGTVVDDAMLVGDGSGIIKTSLCTGGPCWNSTSFLARDAVTFEWVSEGCDFRAWAVTSDGRYVVGERTGAYPTFVCPGANGLVRWDRVTKTAVAIPVADWNPAGISISNDGRFVTALDLAGVAYVVDLRTGVRQVVDTDAVGGRGPSPTKSLSISGSGRYVTFRSADALTPGDGNGVDDVFTRYAVTPEVTGTNPATVARGAHVTIRVIGREFLPGATVEIPGGGITVHDITQVNPARLDVEVTVDPGAAPGRRDVVVRNTGGFGSSAGWCVACLTIS
jgi:hypothetical protein